jgi:ferric-dicitrate binding protein FerR (iron transport regulator)
MDKKIFLEILGRYRKGEASEQEIQMLEAYYDLFEPKANALDELSPQQKLALKQQISINITEKLHSKSKTKSLVFTKKWWSVAAILLAVFAVGISIYHAKKDLSQNPKLMASTVIKPGGNQAILTLADGSTIGLNDKETGSVIHANGVKVIKNGDGQVSYQTTAEAKPSINMIATPRGGQYHLVLADGTKVWLNAASSIKFPTYFSGDSRTVFITGEVYFEVAKDKTMPFLVHTPKQVVEVLGTHFNINSYDDEPKETTTLLEGSVKVSTLANTGLQKGQSKYLTPGQEAILANNGSTISINDADVEAAVAWKNGYFKFDKADIQLVMRQISRWYNVDVKYEGEISNDLFVGKIKRAEDIRGVLRILELSKINTSIKGRTIIITN